jgi:hypothetical protein
VILSDENLFTFEIFEINFFLLGEISAVEKKRRKSSDRR